MMLCGWKIFHSSDLTHLKFGTDLGQQPMPVCKDLEETDSESAEL